MAEAMWKCNIQQEYTPELSNFQNDDETKALLSSVNARIEWGINGLAEQAKELDWPNRLAEIEVSIATIYNWLIHEELNPENWESYLYDNFDKLAVTVPSYNSEWNKIFKDFVINVLPIDTLKCILTTRKETSQLKEEMQKFRSE